MAPGLSGMQAALNETALPHLNRGARGTANETGSASLRGSQADASEAGKAGNKDQRSRQKRADGHLKRGGTDTHEAAATALRNKIPDTAISFPANWKNKCMFVTSWDVPGTEPAADRLRPPVRGYHQ